MKTTQRRLDALERRRRAARAVTIRLLWSNGDGTATDDKTGEIVQEAALGPGAIRLRWPEEAD